MSGWDSWAANIVASGGDGCKGAALYCPSSGSLWGKSGDFDCAGGVQNYDVKAEGKDASPPTVNGLTYMFVRKTMDDDPVSVFRKGGDSLFTMRGPSGSRVAVYVKEVKPEPVVTRVVNYLKPNI